MKKNGGYFRVCPLRQPAQTLHCPHPLPSQLLEKVAQASRLFPLLPEASGTLALHFSKEARRQDLQGKALQSTPPTATLPEITFSGIAVSLK